MKQLLVPPAATARPTAVITRNFCSLIVLAAASLAVLAGCGGEERLSREAFSDRLQSIHRQGSERWGRLAERTGDLKPGQPLPAEADRPMRKLVEFQRQAVGELEVLNPPKSAEEEVETLIEALRERTDTFEQVLVARRFTPRQFDRVTRSGDQIDVAFGQLRNEGFLPVGEEHE
jgi:hypothetical protein